MEEVCYNDNEITLWKGNWDCFIRKNEITDIACFYG